MGWLRRRRWAAYGVVVTAASLTAGGAAVMPASAQDSSAAPLGSAVSAAAESGEALSEELARAAAEASGHPVEIANLRRERREVFANADGSFTAHEYAQPVRTRRGSAWIPVDGTLVKKSDGSWSPKAATVDLQFSDGGLGPFVRMRRVGREYALTWPEGILPKPKVEGSTANYAEVLPGVDLVVRADVEGFSHYFVVKTAEAAANPELDRLELGLSTKGLTVTKTASGALRAVDSAVGGSVFESGRAVMWDSADPASTATAAAMRAMGSADESASADPVLDPADGGRKASVGIEVAKGRISLSPDVELLRGENTSYPVVIDPVPRTTGTTAWTSVMSGMPSEQDWKYSGHAGMGKCPSNYNAPECSGIGVRRLLFSFPMSFYNGKQIISTSFSARVGAVYWAEAKAEPVDLYRIGSGNYAISSSSNWSNTSGSWSKKLMTVDQKISPTTCSSAANLHFSNGALLTETQAAANGGLSTLSLGLKAKDESTYYGWKRICGNSYLSVNYNTPPAQISTSLMSTNPGGKCVVDAAKAPYVDELPQLKTEARDSDNSASYSDQVKVQFQVFYNDKDGVEKSYYADSVYKAPSPGTLFSHTVLQPPLGSGVGMWEPAAKTFHLRNTATAGFPDTKPTFTSGGTVPLAGDWDGGGIDTIGMYDPATSTFRLRNQNTGPDLPPFRYGNVGDIPVVGDWDGDGKDTVGVWRPSNHSFYLANRLGSSAADVPPFVYGATGMTPIAGDWNGDGIDTIGMHDPAHIMIYLRNSNTGGGNHHEIRYGSSGDKPVVGDWNKDNVDTVGVWRPSTHYFYLNNQNTDNITDLSFVYGADSMMPLSGNWIDNSGIPSRTRISWQARAFDGEAWGPWSSANAGRCVVELDTGTPQAPDVLGAPYKDDEVWRSGVGRPGTFTFESIDETIETEVVGYKYRFDDEQEKSIATSDGQARSVTWTPPTWGLHTLTVTSVNAASRTSAETNYQFKVVDDGPVGQWNLGDPLASQKAAEEMGRHAAAVGPGVLFGAEGPGVKPGVTSPDSAAKLNGTSDAYLTVREDDPLKNSAVVDSTQSFSVSAWVKPEALDRDRAVISQDGPDNANFVLGYDASDNKWVFEAPGTGGATTTSWRVQAVGTPVPGNWVHLTGIYDANASGGPKISILVDEQPAVTAARPTSNQQGGDFQIGRSKTDGVYGANFQGAIADVRAYTRVVTTDEIKRFQDYMPARKAYWDFETVEGDGVPNQHSGGEALHLDGPTPYTLPDPILDPEPSLPAMSGQSYMLFDGVDDWAGTAQPVVAGDVSYTVSARVRLSTLDAQKSQAVLSLPGQNTDRLVVRYDAGTQRWQLVLRASDTLGAQQTVVNYSGPPPTVDNSGNHIAVVYDAVTRRVSLYIDGESSRDDVRLDKSPWPSTGGLQVGRTVKGAEAEYLAGAVDEVRVYAGALDQVGINLIASLNPNTTI